MSSVTFDALIKISKAYQVLDANILTMPLT